MRKCLLTLIVALAAMFVSSATAHASFWTQIYSENFASETVPVGAFSGCSTQHFNFALDTCSGLQPYPAAYQNWWAYPDGWTDGLNATYYPSKVLSISGGLLNYRIHSETIGGVAKHLTAAPEPRVCCGVNGYGQLYANYIYRARFDSLPGYHVAFLLWPDDNNKADGEIDFPDDRLDQTSHLDAFVHWPGDHSSFDHFRVAGDITQWHTYQLVWLPGVIKFYVDGVLIGTETAHIPSVPMHFVLQTDTASAGEPAPADSTQGNVQVDWVNVYQPS